MVINRIGQEPFKIKKGMDVDIFLTKDRKTTGIVTGISESRQIVKIGILEYEIAYIYPAGTFIQRQPKQVKNETLSATIKRINRKNEPPGGWGEADLVKMN